MAYIISLEPTTNEAGEVIVVSLGKTPLFTATFRHSGGAYTKNAHGVSEHKGCAGNGQRFWTMESYSNNSWCTGCDYTDYTSIGD
jgi:hypothetical protein